MSMKWDLYLNNWSSPLQNDSYALTIVHVFRHHGVTTGWGRNVSVSSCYFQRMQVENFVNIILTMLYTSFRGSYLLVIISAMNNLSERQLICPLLPCKGFMRMQVFIYRFMSDN